MRIRVPPARRRLDRITVNLAAMIDVSFLLLFYFMVATMLQDRETRLSAGLHTQSPGAAGSVGDFQTQNIEVRLIDSAPCYVIGAHVCKDRNQLAAALAPLPKSAGAFVKVFDDVSVGFAVAAVQVAHDAGFDQVTYVPAK
ncbi:MAG: biopolymer transporter ExbD [Phycisphaerales bacterium]|nr:biopolymer transporter ExbD [Phycisphaerales bacterium]MCI0630344.1 biopolymer transporter ExbD [Phycisphaerales bacterium]